MLAKKVAAAKKKKTSEAKTTALGDDAKYRLNKSNAMTEKDIEEDHQKKMKLI